MKYWFNNDMFTLEECKQMEEWIDMIFLEEMSLDDIPVKYKEAVNGVLNSK